VHPKIGSCVSHHIPHTSPYIHPKVCHSVSLVGDEDHQQSVTCTLHPCAFPQFTPLGASQTHQGSLSSQIRMSWELGVLKVQTCNEMLGPSSSKFGLVGLQGAEPFWVPLEEAQPFCTSTLWSLSQRSYGRTEHTQSREMPGVRLGWT